MWLFSERGFYSVVEKQADREQGLVTVRSRTKADLDRLSDLISAKPYRKDYSDYPWRLRCTKDEWSAAVYEMAQEIDYPNFKNRVHDTLGARRSNVYMRVWSALLGLESTRTKKRKLREWRDWEKHRERRAAEYREQGLVCRECTATMWTSHADDCSVARGLVLRQDCDEKQAA